MSTKIDVLFVVRKHFSHALFNHDDKKLCAVDVFVFILLPIALGVFSYFSKVAGSSESVSLLITASSIFAGLLLNLLVLVYDQSKRVDEKLQDLYGEPEKPVAAEKLQDLIAKNPTGTNPLVDKYETHKVVLAELVSNISYSIVASLIVILFCVLSYLSEKVIVSYGFESFEFSLKIANLLFSFAIIFSANLLITLLMIVKRVIKLIDNS